MITAYAHDLLSRTADAHDEEARQYEERASMLHQNAEKLLRQAVEERGKDADLRLAVANGSMSPEEIPDCDLQQRVEAGLKTGARPTAHRFRI